MTQEAFRLVGVVEARTRAAENDLRRFDRVAQNSARNFNTSMGSTERGALSAGKAASSFLERFGHISNIIQGIPQIGALAGALTRPLFQAAEAGIKLNMTLEQAAIGYEQVAGSQAKALKFLKELQAFGQRSPFRFEGLLQASRLMTTFGFDLSEQIPKLTIWGNAIASSGELSADKIHDVVTAFGQMRMAGRVNGQDMMQLTNANIPGWELLAKAIGKTVAETRKLSEAGRLDGGKAVEAITSMMEIDPRFKNMMARLEKTTAGRLSAAEDVLQFAQATATKSLTGDISKTLEASLGRADLANSLATKIDSSIKPISGALTGVITATLTGDADGLKNVAKDVLGSALSNGLTEGITSGMGSVKAAIGGLVQEGVVNPFKSLLGINSPSTVFIGYGHNAAEGFTIGFAEGLNNGTFDTIIERFLGRIEGKLSASKKRSAENLAKLMQREPGFKDKLIAGSRARGINPDDLLNVMALETAGTFSPSKTNSRGYTGLIQFGTAAAADMGTTTGKLRSMSATQQLDYVFKYLDQHLNGFIGKMAISVDQLYSAIGAGHASHNPSKVMFSADSPDPRNRAGFHANPSWNVNGDRQIQQWEFGAVPQKFLGAGVNFTVNGSPSVSSSNPMPVTVVSVVGGNGPAVTGAQSSKAEVQIQLAKFFAQWSQMVARGAKREPTVGADVGGYAFHKKPAAIVSDVLSSQLVNTTNVMATSIMPRATQALEQMADNTERMVKGAGEWKDVIVESEEATRRLKVHWSGIAQSFESAFLNATGQALQGNFGDAIKGFFLDFSFDIAQQVNSAFAARLSKSLFDFQGSDSDATGGLVSKFLNKIGLGPILEKAGLQPKAASRPRRASGSMPESKGGPIVGVDVGAGAGIFRQAVQNSTDKITSSQQAQTALLTTAMASNTDRIVEALTPEQPGFWSGLLSAAVSGAASGAAGALVGDILGGDNTQRPDEGPRQPRPTTPPVLKFPNGRRATGGIINGPGTETSDSILGVDRQGIPTAMVSQGEFVVNAAATRKNRAALELINKTGKLPRFGFGGFLKWTSPISHKSVRDVTMPITREGVRNATMPAVGYLSSGSHSQSSPRSGVGSITQTNGRETQHHYHFNLHTHGNDAANQIKKSRGQIQRQMAASMRSVAA